MLRFPFALWLAAAFASDAVSPLALRGFLLRGATRGRAASAGAALSARLCVGLLALFHVVLAPLLFAIGGAQLASSSHAALALASKAEIPAREGVEVAGIGLSDPLVGEIRAFRPPAQGDVVLVKHQSGPMGI